MATKRQKTTPKILDEALRRGHAYQLRIEGKTFDQIGAQLGITRQAAWKMVSAELKQVKEEYRDDVRELELSRLEDLYAKAYEIARAGPALVTLQAVGTLLSISKRRATMLGLDMPTRVDATVTAEVTQQSVELQKMLSDAKNKAAEEERKLLAKE